MVNCLSGNVDKVCYKLPSTGDDVEKVAVFKYSGSGDPYGKVWGEIQIMSQFPRDHPHLLSLDSIILEELSGLGVVGFTTPFIPSPTLEKLLPIIKLRWLKELMAVVDELNLEYGIIHQGIADRNIFINPATDSILLFDFEGAAGIGNVGTPGYSCYKPARNDVKGVVLLAYYLVTRDPQYDMFLLNSAD